MIHQISASFTDMKVSLLGGSLWSNNQDTIKPV